jgi:hypothetical protein
MSRTRKNSPVIPNSSVCTALLATIDRSNAALVKDGKKYPPFNMGVLFCR